MTYKPQAKEQKTNKPTMKDMVSKMKKKPKMKKMMMLDQMQS